MQGREHGKYVSVDGWDGAWTVEKNNFMTENGDEGRTRVGHWVKGTREREF